MIISGLGSIPTGVFEIHMPETSCGYHIPLGKSKVRGGGGVENKRNVLKIILLFIFHLSSLNGHWYYFVKTFQFVSKSRSRFGMLS